VGICISGKIGLPHTPQVNAFGCSDEIDIESIANGK
jgi:hypothetical protein